MMAMGCYWSQVLGGLDGCYVLTADPAGFLPVCLETHM